MAPVKKTKKSVKSLEKTEAVEEEIGVVSGQLKKKIVKQQQKKTDQRGVVFIKHLPHGFFEEQLKNYFEQFGAVTRLRLARSKRTGGSKGFAFVEFAYPEVAQVAAETMDNYLMFKKLVKAAYIPPEKQVYNYFKSKVRKVKNKAGKEIYVSGKTSSIQSKVKRFNNWTEDAYQKRTESQLKKLNKLNKKYAHLGIDFSKILIEPKKLTAEETTAANAAKEENAGSSKRKATDGSHAKSTKNSKKEIGLEDLLGATINDDSGDEDYIAMPDSEDDLEAESSDEEAYGFKKDSDEEQSDDEEDDGDSDDDENEEIEEVNPKKLVKSNKKPKLSYSKPIKASKVDRFEELMKRKPKMGGIQKLNKKPHKKPIVVKAKNQMVLGAAKELVKTQSTTLKSKRIGKTKSTATAKATKKRQKS